MSKTILLIDDEPEFLELMTVRVKGSGYEVVTAKDGQEGFAKAKSQKPDLIILDVIMPNQDGYSLVRDLKKSPDLKDVPLIVLTAKDKMKDLFSLEGVHDFLVKPVKAEVLLEHIRKLIGD